MSSHPDLGGSHTEQAKINVAYEILSDPVQRQAHDIYWKITRRSSNFANQAKPTQQNKNRSAQSEDSVSEPFAAFRHRLDAAIQSKKAQIWAEFETVKIKRQDDLARRFSEETKTFYAFSSSCVLAGLAALLFPIIWVVFGILAFISVSKLKGVLIGDERIPLFAHDIQTIIERQAHKITAKESHDRSSAFDRYTSDLAALVDLTTRPSSFDDSEIQIVRRLAATLFLTGFSVSHYDNENRIILFADQDEKLLVRFRHRSGAATNTAYVDKMHELMSIYQTSNAILFCSPGLSDNAAKLAKQKNIKWYTLESMNSWIDQILSSDHAGPTGDIFTKLDELRNFLSGVAPRVSQWRRRRRY
ncbi:hypothetical protein BH10PSE10_BH10PSE10_07120 [soil metagenome]